MSVEIKVPLLPESVADATMLRWHVQVGQHVRRDENMVDIETEKVVLEVPAPKDGVITKILRSEGDTVLANDVIALFEEGVAANDESADTQDASEGAEIAKEDPVVEPSVPAGASTSAPPAHEKPAAISPSGPAAKQVARERGVDLATVQGSGRAGRILKEDVLSHPNDRPAPATGSTSRETHREPMSRLRKTIASRLLNAQQESAILTTFNEVDLYEVKALRTRYRDAFEKAHGVR
ncbi:MAG: biotin/lipoyl-containing protein, partial [Gammaproteobacteria bacterium]